MTTTAHARTPGPGPHPTSAASDGTPAAEPVVELGHVVLYVSSLSRSVEFYGDLLGWRQILDTGPHGGAAAFSGGRTHHELLLIEVGPQATPIPSGRRVGMYHFGVKIGDHDDRLREMIARVQARPDLASVVGTSDHTVTHSLYVLDPDGNELELYVDVPGVDWRNDPSRIAQPTRPLIL